jgi:hypothetical protein
MAIPEIRKARCCLSRQSSYSLIYHPEMEADFAVELGANDESLELPWGDASGGDSAPRYYDLKQHPELLLTLEEVRRVPELGEFLSALNSPASALETVKCDAWVSGQMNPEEEIFGAACKFGSYVDLVFASQPDRFSFPAHERFVRELVQLLKRVPEIPATAEFLIRRCYFHCDGEAQQGFYFTFYLFGYADDESQSRRNWTIALKPVENAVLQLSHASQCRGGPK